MKKVFSIILASILVFGIGVVPSAGASADGPIIIPNWRGEVDIDELRALDVPPPYAILPAPGETMRKAMNGEEIYGSHLIGGNGYKAELFVSRAGNPGRSENSEIILVGDLLEFYGESVIIYEDGHKIYPTREIFADGERLTFVHDRSRAHLTSEVYALFRITNSTRDGELLRFSDNRGYGRSLYDSYGGKAGPFTLARPSGGGSVRDIVTNLDGGPWSWSGSVGNARTVPVGVSPTSPKDPPLPPTELPSEWARPEVERAGGLGLLPKGFQSGYTRTTTRAEFTRIAVTLYEKLRSPITGRTTFNDTNDVFVEKAAYIGLVSGVGNGRFDPDSPLTREQAAVMLTRLSDIMGKPFPNQSPTFRDNGEIAQWALEGVGRAQASGIVGGVGNNTFSPKGPYTIEQSIATIMRMYDYMQ